MVFRILIITTLSLHAHFIHAEDASKLRVVASFSILGDLVATLGGQHVDLTTLVGPNSDGHLYQPKPADATAIAKAQLLVINGLYFEGWVTRLIESADYKGTVVIASDGIEPLLASGQPDPHAWHSLTHIRQYASNLTNAFIQQKPAARAEFVRLNSQFIDAIDALQREAETLLSRTPSDRRRVVTSHDAFAYLGHEFGLHFVAPLGMSTDEEASAGDVARLIRQIRELNITAVFVDNIADERLLKQIMRETEADIGGRIYSDALSEAGGSADTYLNMMRHNLRMIGRALQQSATPSLNDAP